MISQIRGILISRSLPEVIIDVGGVGYEINVPTTTFYQLLPLGQEVILLTHLVVREDSQQLFGFLEPADRRLFRELIKVSGLGPRLALTLLSGMDARAFAQCLNRNDTSSLTALPGVGKKIAERLLMEMRDKAGIWLEELSPPEILEESDEPIYAAQIDQRLEAESALTGLGYKPSEASRLIAEIDIKSDTSSEEIIRLALRYAGGGKG